MKRTLFVLVGVLVAAVASAETWDAALAKAQAALPKMFHGITAADVSETPVPGLYAVAVKHRILYVTGDGKYIVRGDLISAASEENYTAESEGRLRVAALKGLSDSDMIVYGDKSLPHTVTVFLDVDCAYCALLYKEVPKMNALGVRVRFVAFPRSGVNTPSWYKAEAVWCAADRQGAYEAALKGKLDFSHPCAKNPVGTEYALGMDLGVTDMGTPTTITDKGVVVFGYRPAQIMADIANGKQTM